MAYVAGIELGGTTCVAAISEVKNPEKILERKDFKTCEPASTLDSLLQFLREILKKYEVASFQAIGIASFGPVDLRKGSPKYGYVLTSPKPGWQHIDVVGVFRREFGDSVLVVFETDVNAPAIAEAMVSVVPRLPNVVYITVGTGVGVGVYINGSPVHGLLHPEAGHMMVGVKPGDTYPGGCPFHMNCVEGMVNSNALAARAGVHPSELVTLPDTHWVWEIAGYYLGALCVNLTYTLSPDVIILGGGVMQRDVIFDLCRNSFKQLNAGYLMVEKFETDEDLTEYICGSKFGNNAGIIGALLLAISTIKTV